MSVQPEESDEEEGAAATDHNDDAKVLGKDAEDDEDAREVLKLEALPNTQPPGLPLTTSPSLPPPPPPPAWPFLCPQHLTLPGLAPLVTQVAHTPSRPFPALSLVEK